MKEKIQKLLKEKLTFLELKGKGACNNAYYVETQSGKKFIIKEQRVDKEFKEQNPLCVEAKVIKQLSKLNFSTPVPKLSFVSKKSDMLSYFYIEGEPLIEVWKNLSEKERIKICKDLGHFHSEIGRKVTEKMARKMGVQINRSSSLHPEVEKEYNEALICSDLPLDFKKLAKRAKTFFDQTLNSVVFQFLHNDSHHENIIIKNKKIAGVIDFGDSEYGEIAKEFSRYIRDYPDYAEYIISAYEKASGNKLSRERLVSNSFLSDLMDNLEDYRKGGASRVKAKKSLVKYRKMLDRMRGQT